MTGSPPASGWNMAHTRQSRPDCGLGFQVNVLNTFGIVPSSLGNDALLLLVRKHMLYYCSKNALLYPARPTRASIFVTPKQSINTLAEMTLVCLPTCLPTYLPTYPPTPLSTSLFAYLPTYLPTFLSASLSTSLCTSLFAYLPACLPTYLPPSLRGGSGA